jgi:hypothetical protein
MLRSTTERQDDQEKLMHERALTQEQKLYEHTQAMYDLIDERLASTPEKNVRRSRGSDIPIDNSTYEEFVDSKSELRIVEMEQVVEAMSIGSGLRKNTRRDVSRKASERDEAVHLFQPGFTEDDYDSRMYYDEIKSREQEKRYRRNSIEYTPRRTRESKEKTNNTPKGQKENPTMNTQRTLSNMDGSTRKICIDGKLYIIQLDVDTPTVCDPKDMQESSHSMKKIPKTSLKESKEKERNTTRDSSSYYTNSDNESVPDKHGRTSRRNNGDGEDDDPDDPESDTEEDESTSGSEYISSYDSEGHRKRKVRRTKKRKTSKVRSNRSRMNRTVIQQEEKFDKEKMLTSTGIGSILRFIKTYNEYQNELEYPIKMSLIRESSYA